MWKDWSPCFVGTCLAIVPGAGQLILDGEPPVFTKDLDSLPPLEAEAA
jgi:hypothetical protein